MEKEKYLCHFIKFIRDSLVINCFNLDDYVLRIERNRKRILVYFKGLLYKFSVASFLMVDL